MFELDRFIADCKAAPCGENGPKSDPGTDGEAVSDPAQVFAYWGNRKGGIESAVSVDELTVMNLVWGPHMTAMPHNHHMWAAIGMYGGREDNIFWRTLPEDAAGRSRPPAFRR